MNKRLARFGLYFSLVICAVFWYLAIFVIDWFDKDDRFRPTFDTFRYYREYQETVEANKKATR